MRDITLTIKIRIPKFIDVAMAIKCITSLVHLDCIRMDGKIVEVKYE